MPNPILTSERLTLRPYRLSDAQHLRALIDEPGIATMLARVPHPYPEGEAERWIGTHDSLRAEDKGYPFAIERDDRLLGTIGIERDVDGDFELGYWLGTAHWGQGFATEAARAILCFAFEGLNLAFMRARVISGNRASANVLAKLGFLATGRSRTFHAVRQTEVESVHLVLPHNAFTGESALCTRSAA